MQKMGKFPGVGRKEPGKCPAAVYKCEGESSIGSDERHQYSQAKFSAENRDILNEIHYILSSQVPF